MKQIEAVIFDWAGTTVDYGCMAPIYAMREAFKQHNLMITLDEIRQPMGMLKIDHIKAILDMERVRQGFNQQHGRQYQSEDVDSIYSHFEKGIFSILHQHTTLIDGLLPVQDYLRHQNIKIGSTTGYTQKMIAVVAKSAYDQGYRPDYIISADEVRYGRPYPYMIQQNMSALGIKDVRNVLKVGDTIVDIQEGLNAGCWSAGVIMGSSMLGLNSAEVTELPHQEISQRIKQVKYQMLQAGADFVIDHISEVPLIVELIQQKMNYC